MTKLLLVNLLLSTIACVLTRTAESDLLAVVVIFRHGDRTIVRPYPSDPYKNSSYWPDGFGQLTNAGKERHLQLGKWLRSRYNTFLPLLYSQQDIYVRSTDVDRTLMSAEANLAGLYPPRDRQIWDQTIPWQPIPIHTTPEHDDAVLAMKKHCPTYTKQLNKLFATKFFQDIKRKNHDLYAFLTRSSGDSINSLESLEYLYNTLLIESLFNYTLPQWAQAVFPRKLEPWAFLSFATAAYTPQLARLKTGPLLNEILDFFQNKTSQTPDSHLLHIYSGHDTTIANVLNTLGVFEPHSPPYASTILFELHHNTSIRFFYKNSTEARELTIRGCEPTCSLAQLVELLKPVVVTMEQWERECHASWMRGWPLFAVSMFMFLLLIGVYKVGSWVFGCGRKKKEREGGAYIQLPNEESA